MSNDQQKTAFVAWVRQARPSVLLRHVADLMDDRRDPYYHIPVRILDDFAETDGWFGVLTVIADVMRDTETPCQERSAS